MLKKKILLVDDEPTILRSLSNYLGKSEYEILIVESGDEALSLLQSFPFDLVITDLAMEGTGGMEVLREAKKINSDTCVFILTGYGNMQSVIEAMRFGADDYILKPCDAEELLLKIDRVFEKQEALRKIKIYEKIIPICMYCKKIRDDSGSEIGAGQWLRLEKYLAKRNGAMVSHGCCPECYEEQMAAMD